MANQRDGGSTSTTGPVKFEPVGSFTVDDDGNLVVVVDEPEVDKR